MRHLELIQLRWTLGRAARHVDYCRGRSRAHLWLVVRADAFLAFCTAGRLCVLIIVGFFGSILIVRRDCTSGEVVSVERSLSALVGGLHGGARVGIPKPRVRGFRRPLKR